MVVVGPWALEYEGFDTAQEGVREALCTLGNGYVASRAAAPEACADGVHYPGTYVAGCYDRLVTDLAGRDVEHEDMVNLPNWLPLTFRIEAGAWFSLDEIQLLAYRQQLDLARGILTRFVRFRDANGRVARLAERRIVSMDDPHLLALETTIVPDGWGGRVEIRSGLDGRVENAGVARYRSLNGAHLRPAGAGHDGDTMWLHVMTATSHVEIALAARTRITGGTDAPPARVARIEEDQVAQEIALDALPGVPIKVEKIVALHTSRDRAVAECVAAARERVARAPDLGVLLQRHSMAWAQLWRRCRIRVHGEGTRALNLGMFHLLQTLSEQTAELDAGVPARGLHGEAYRGHVFWDELFVEPYFNLRVPEVTRGLLMYRWRRLPEARWAAREAGLEGAMYPWQSGSDGREETPTVHLNPLSGRWFPDHSRLQRHVGLAIAYDIWQYYQATADVGFLCSYGAEMLFEIARFWASIARHDDSVDRYDIRGVVGPDEYHDAYPDAHTPGIDNNAYTNVMTVWMLRRALETLRILPPYRHDELRERLGIRGSEIQRWTDMIRRMRVPFHSDGVISQFEGYDRLAELDWARYRRTHGDIRRLDRILEPEGDSPNRYKVSKQADVLMLFYLLSAEELAEILTTLGYPYDASTIPQTIDYYLARTSHGSTLSAVVHAWVLARANRPASWRFFQEALAGDVRDVQGGSTAEGIHLGAMAGTVDLVQRCFTGIETRGDALHLDPHLPREMGALRFEVRYRGHPGIVIRCTHNRVSVTLPPSEGAPIRVRVRDRTVLLEPGHTWGAELRRG